MPPRKGSQILTVLSTAATPLIAGVGLVLFATIFALMLALALIAYYVASRPEPPMPPLSCSQSEWLTRAREYTTEPPRAQ